MKVVVDDASLLEVCPLIGRHTDNMLYIHLLVELLFIYKNVQINTGVLINNVLVNFYSSPLICELHILYILMNW